MGEASESNPAPSSSLYWPEFEQQPHMYGWPRENAKGYKIQERLCGSLKPIRVIHIGAGISGICLAKFLPEEVTEVTLTCYDKNSDIGGTWLENRYPGCACDIPSVNYQFTWARNPNWSRFYSYSEEIWQYLRDVVDTFDLNKYFTLNHEVKAAAWDEESGTWEVTVQNLLSGETFVDKAEVLINGSGVLNDWKWPEIEGLHSFQGKLCHTARYDTSIDLKGKRVAVIGMGSSGIQITAEISSQVDQLYTWIRSPTWVTAGFAQNHAGPNGANFEYSSEQKAQFARDPLAYLDYCKQIESELNQRFKFILNGTPDAAQAKEFSTNQMKQRLSNNKELVDKLIPTAFNVGCRRPTPGNGFLEALVRPNVKTFIQGIQKITPAGFVNVDGTEYEVDVIICATGFNTSWVPRFPITAYGKNLQDMMDGQPVSYLSISVPEFPNYWMGVGPYGPLGHGSFIPIIEHVMHHVIKIINKIQKENIRSLAPRREVCEAFTEHADLFLQRTAWSGKCPSWFKQGRLDGKLAIFPGSRLVYFDLLESPRYEDYVIKYEHGNPFSFLGNGFTVKEFDGSDLAYYLGTQESPGGMLPGNVKRENQVDGIV
ncbi:hypothetical protein AJ78_03635 [Emergomyces pasteurianus Ep9510]|uniref:Uncharacterized protein n=1 Tax=Emergomyces pasteurianus Ep9510 TaxID=1447872 RepID=A0A1J9Q7I6_9EURO|nr:hypothetical protein AJ78_03635 [Emergomyces pasteurianus Ep9510]